MKFDAGDAFVTGVDGETVHVSFDRDFPHETKIKIDHVGGDTVQQWIFLTPEAAETLAIRLLSAVGSVRAVKS